MLSKKNKQNMSIIVCKYFPCKKDKICMYMLNFEKNKDRKDKAKTFGSQGYKTERNITHLKKLGAQL